MKLLLVYISREKVYLNKGTYHNIKHLNSCHSELLQCRECIVYQINQYCFKVKSKLYI